MINLNQVRDIIESCTYSQRNILETGLNVEYSLRDRIARLDPYYRFDQLSSTGTCAELMEYTYQEQDKERLDKFLLNHLDISRSQIKKVILDGQVTVNGKVSTVHHWLKHGDKILYEQKVVVQEPATFDTEPKIIRQVDEYLILEKHTSLNVCRFFTFFFFFHHHPSSHHL